MCFPIPPRSVCWQAELIVRGSSCHRAGTGDQDKVGENQESTRVGEMESDRILMRLIRWFPDGSDYGFWVAMERLTTKGSSSEMQTEEGQCHLVIPSPESQKKIALDTEQKSTPHFWVAWKMSIKHTKQAPPPKLHKIQTRVT